MDIKDMIEGFVMQWAIYFVVAYVVVIITNQAIALVGAIIICALLSFLAAIVTTIIFLWDNSRLRRLTEK